MFQRIWEEIPFAYYHEFFPGKSRRKLIEIYAVTGGVPKYIELFSESRDIYSAIDSCVLNRSGYLYDDPHFLLQQEVSEVGSYFSVIRAIAASNSKPSVLETKATSLTTYLKTLIDLDILEREVPITEENSEKSKRSLYRIKDNYIRFWFAFVYEDVCRERIWELNAEGAWPFNFSKLGRYWDSNTEIDIAALDTEDNNLILGECKYWQEPVGISVLRNLEEKAKTVSWKQETRKTWFVLFGCNGFTEELRKMVAERECIRRSPAAAGAAVNGRSAVSTAGL